MRPVVVHARQPQDYLCRRGVLPFPVGPRTYVRENGEEIPVEAGMLVFFPAGWAGTSTITQTLTKAFMCR
ncbi:hypothetical protein NKL04_29400 [Mesorhizobium sp. C264A]